VTPLVLFGGNEEAALNFAQLLQTLDVDKDLSNGIVIDAQLLVTLETIDFYSASFDEDIQALLGDVVLVSEADAQLHLEETFIVLDINADGIFPRTVVKPKPKNSAPVATLSSFSVDENSFYEGRFTATDADGDTLIYRYTIAPTHGSLVGVNSNGEFIYIPNTNYDGSDSFSYKVNDSKEDSESKTITISVVNTYTPPPTNYAPVITSRAIVSVNENQTGALTVTAIDVNGNPIIFSLSGTDALSFDINATSGVVTFKVAPDYETKSSYIFTANASDESLSASQSVTISIINVAETLPTLENFTTLIDENIAIGTVVGNITLIDSGDTAITSFTLSDIVNFEVNTTGHIKTKTTLDYEITTEYNLTAYATNGVGNSASVDVDISINDVAETEIYIKSAVYDNNRTTTTADDKFYIYLNKTIDEGSITVDTSLNYDIIGTGAIGSASGSDYNDSVFYRHFISQDDGSTGSLEILTANGTNISLAINTITTDVYGSYPSDYNQTVVEKFNVFARLKTGQITSYPDANASDCDDGHYQKETPRSYTDNANGTVTDNATGLIWQKEDDNNTYTWSSDGVVTEASDYCTTLDLGGSTSWRLPTIEELVSILDIGRYSPAIDTVYTNTNSSSYWSSTTYAPDVSYAWFVGFSNGGGRAVDKTANRYVCCVR
jgi:hypothetical protein